MGEARRRAEEGLLPRTTKKKLKKDASSWIADWLPTTEKKRIQLIDLTIRGGWVGIGLLVLIWIVVRFLGPAAGWWIPADLP